MLLFSFSDKVTFFLEIHVFVCALLLDFYGHKFRVSDEFASPEFLLMENRVFPWMETTGHQKPSKQLNVSYSTRNTYTNKNH